VGFPLGRPLVYTANVPRIRAVRILGAVAVAGLLGVLGGCAKGTAQQYDAATPQKDANTQQQDGNTQQQDAGTQQQDAGGDGPAVQNDGPKDGAVQQDAQHDGPIQQDAQHDVLVQTDRQTDVAECTQNADCFTDAGAPTDGPGIYCYVPRGKCYEAGGCKNTDECYAGATCDPVLVVKMCSCNLLGPVFCREGEVCLPVPMFGNRCTAE
jgi:hypothetical protein